MSAEHLDKIVSEMYLKNATLFKRLQVGAEQLLKEQGPALATGAVCTGLAVAGAYAAANYFDLMGSLPSEAKTLFEQCATQNPDLSWKEFIGRAISLQPGCTNGLMAVADLGLIMAAWPTAIYAIKSLCNTVDRLLQNNPDYHDQKVKSLVDFCNEVKELGDDDLLKTGSSRKAIIETLTAHESTSIVDDVLTMQRRQRIP